MLCASKEALSNYRYFFLPTLLGYNEEKETDFNKDRCLRFVKLHLSSFYNSWYIYLCLGANSVMNNFKVMTIGMHSLSGIFYICYPVG